MSENDKIEWVTVGGRTKAAFFAPAISPNERPREIIKNRPRVLIFVDNISAIAPQGADASVVFLAGAPAIGIKVSLEELQHELSKL